MQFTDQYEKILHYARDNGRTPSLSEIQKLFHYKSKNAAQYLVSKLVEVGYVTKSTTGKIQLRKLEDVPIEFIGSMHAGKTVGFPNPAEEETAEVMTLSELLLVDLHAAKLFRVQGDSMIDAGIYENDILLVECTDKWKDGDIVIAEIDGEETVKYIKKKKNGSAYLVPANEAMQPMVPEEYLKVKAVVKNVIRSYGR